MYSGGRRPYRNACELLEADKDKGYRLVKRGQKLYQILERHRERCEDIKEGRKQKRTKRTKKPKKKKDEEVVELQRLLENRNPLASEFQEEYRPVRIREELLPEEFKNIPYQLTPYKEIASKAPKNQFNELHQTMQNKSIATRRKNKEKKKAKKAKKVKKLTEKQEFIEAYKKFEKAKLGKLRPKKEYMVEANDIYKNRHNKDDFNDIFYKQIMEASGSGYYPRKRNMRGGVLIDNFYDF